MKIIVTTLIVVLTSCVEQRPNLDYPTKIGDIEEVTLTLPPWFVSHEPPQTI